MSSLLVEPPGLPHCCLYPVLSYAVYTNPGTGCAPSDRSGVSPEQRKATEMPKSPCAPSPEQTGAALGEPQKNRVHRASSCRTPNTTSQPKATRELSKRGFPALPLLTNRVLNGPSPSRTLCGLRLLHDQNHTVKVLRFSNFNQAQPRATFFNKGDLFSLFRASAIYRNIFSLGPRSHGALKTAHGLRKSSPLLGELSAHCRPLRSPRPTMLTTEPCPIALLTGSCHLSGDTALSHLWQMGNRNSAGVTNLAADTMAQRREET